MRVEYPGALYHVTSRGNERKAIFRDEEDRRTFLEILTSINQRYHWLCHAYCLMDNHYHLVVETPDGNLSKGMRQLNGVYTQTFNKKYRRVGHLFQGRYKAILVEKESYFLEVCRYVVLNPLRVKGAKRLERWAWSSYPGTAGLKNPHACLTTEGILGQMSGGRGDAEKKYRLFIKEGIGKEPLWESLRGQSLLGGESFVQGLVRHVRKHQAVKEIPRSQRFVSRPALDRFLKKERVADKKTRKGKIVQAVMTHGYSQKEVADHLGMHYSSISRLINDRSEQKSRFKT
jgi:REP element-mobilizing transposase RayT